MSDFHLSRILNDLRAEGRAVADGESAEGPPAEASSYQQFVTEESLDPITIEDGTPSAVFSASEEMVTGGAIDTDGRLEIDTSEATRLIPDKI